MRRLLLITGLALACSGCAAYGPAPDYDYGYGYTYGSYYPSGYRYGYGTNAYPSYRYSYPYYGYSAPYYYGYASGPSFNFGFSGSGATR